MLNWGEGNRSTFDYFRSDIKAGKNWQSKDHELEDNLLERGCMKTKARG